MLHVSAITAIIRQSLYKNVQSKANTDEERDLITTVVRVSPL